MTTRNFRDPRERVTMQTAYTLAHRQVRVDVGANAVGTDKFGANLQLGVGFGRHAQFETNLAHAALGAPNFRFKYNFLDRPRIALSAEAGLLYTAPRMLWALPAETRDPLGDVDIVNLPVALRATLPVADFLDLSLGVGYTAGLVTGEVVDGVTVYESAAGPRSFYLDPQLTFYIGGHAALFAGAHLPPYAALAGELTVTETVAPGVEGGIRTVAWEPIPFAALVRAHAGVELRFGRSTHMQVFVAHNGISRFVGAPVLPGINFYWRLP